jgi:hypothetical protein
LLLLQELISRFHTIITRIIPDFATSTSASQSNNNNFEGPYGGNIPALPPAVPSSSSSSSSAYINPYKIGRSDLDPFSNIPQYPGSTPIPIVGNPNTAIDTGGGSYVGANHPIFSPGPNNNNNPPFFQPAPGGGPAILPGFAAPQPRGDATVREILNPNMGRELGFINDDDDPFGWGLHGGLGRGGGRGGRGIGGRGGMGGRGGGRGNNVFPGEPNPDHFKPPGW